MQVTVSRVINIPSRQSTGEKFQLSDSCEIRYQVGSAN